MTLLSLTASLIENSLPSDSPAGRAALGIELHRLALAAQSAGRVFDDPILFAHEVSPGIEREVVGFFAACLAYGRADLIARAMVDVVDRMGPDLAQAIMTDNLTAAQSRFSGFVYRVTRGVDLSRLWVGLGRLIQEYGTLGEAFTAGDPGDTPTLREAMVAFREAIWQRTPEFEPRRAFRHLLPDPKAGSACKRFNMFLRWMVRGPDAVDFGQWSHLGAHRLVMPLDTHIHRIGRYIGLTERTQADWRTAVEITSSLREFDRADPVRFDFALAHMGISGACPSRRVDSICKTCSLQTLCQLPP